MTTFGSNLVAEQDTRLRKKSPLRATMPLQAMHRTSPLRLRNRISPETELSPNLDLSSLAPSKERTWLNRGCGGEGSTHMRRTASLDAIYYKGQWSKETQPLFTNLLLDKATQTPEEWSACSLAEVVLGCVSCINESPLGSCHSSANGSSSSSRRPSGSLPSSPWPSGGGGTPQPSLPHIGENIEKLIKQRFQRTNKETGVGLGQRYSPIQADHSVLTQSPHLAKPTACIQANGTPRSGSIPHLPRPLLPRLRSSVEELNQEIERLVLKTSPHSPEDSDEWCTSQQDGRKAPFPDCFKYTRNANTQTPARCSSETSGNSSIRTSPSSSPAMSPPAVHSAVTPPDSPCASRLPTSFMSPHINKFLAREPPDGCEKVSLKSSEELLISGSASGGTSWPPSKPLAAFTLLPSRGSAFCAPDILKSSAEALSLHCGTISGATVADPDECSERCSCPLGKDEGALQSTWEEAKSIVELSTADEGLREIGTSLPVVEQ